MQTETTGTEGDEIDTVFFSPSSNPLWSGFIVSRKEFLALPGHPNYPPIGWKGEQRPSTPTMACLEAWLAWCLHPSGSIACLHHAKVDASFLLHDTGLLIDYLRLIDVVTTQATGRIEYSCHYSHAQVKDHALAIWRDIFGAEYPDHSPLSQVPGSCDGGKPTADNASVQQYVKADQMAAMVSRSKRTLEKLATRKEDPLPNPDISGGGGKPNEWLWSRIRPWLEAEYGRNLPPNFPGGRS